MLRDMSRDAAVRHTSELIRPDIGPLTPRKMGPDGQTFLHTSSDPTSMRCDGAKISSIRKSLKLTQQEVAARADLSSSAVARIERGLLVFTPTVQEVAAVLGLSLSDMKRPDDVGSGHQAWGRRHSQLCDRRECLSPASLGGIPWVSGFSPACCGAVLRVRGRRRRRLQCV